MTGIVVGVDDSPSSMHALRWAIEEARLRSATLRVVSAWEFPFAPATNTTSAVHDDDDLLPQVPSLEQSALDELAMAVTEAGGDPKDAAVSMHVVHGSPVRVLLDAAKDADLLVVGSRGRGGFTGLLLGSVSHECARRAACPVVVVR
jgi:nucleotide-binding universal stress UspA family protein